MQAQLVADVIVEITADLSTALTSREVEAFLLARPAATPFDTWAWLSAGAQAASDQPRYILTARSPSGELLGWLALAAQKERHLGLSITVLRQLTYPRSDRHGLLTTPDLLDALCAKLAASRTPFAAIILDEVASPHPAPDFPKAWSAQILRETPVLHFEEFPDGLPKSFARRVRRARKKLAQHPHEIRFWCPGADELPGLLAEIRAVENASWKGTDAVGIFSSDEGARFFETIAEQMAEAGTLYIGTIRINGALATYRFGFLWQGMYYDYNFAYLPEHASLGLGRILLDEIILQLRARQMRGVDGSRVGAHYQTILSELTEKSVTHRRLLRYRASLPGLLMRAKFQLLKPVGRRIRRALKRGR